MDATNGNGSNGWSMGLKGPLAALANLTAVAVICLMFYQGQTAQMQLAREDRAMFREELKAIRDERDRDRQVAAKLIRSIEAMAEEVRALKFKDAP